MSSPDFLEEVFRQEYGGLVSTLARRFGLPRLQAIEDAVQTAWVAALETWPVQGTPDRPSAWLYRVAHRSLLEQLRAASRHRRILDANAPGRDALGDGGEPAGHFEAELQDDLLRMLFVSCDPAVPQTSRLVFALKTLCGLQVAEIASALFLSEANVYKRLSRARHRLQSVVPLGELQLSDLEERRDAVHQVLYLLFTEGYLSAHAETAVRRELCSEAIRLTMALARHPVGQGPQTAALLALMHLHIARLDARTDPTGGLLLLEEQDRSLWDRKQIAIGFEWLAKSADGEVFSRYHAEAGIAAEHCRAMSFEETRWDRVVRCYALLERDSPSLLHRLNRAVALAEWQGPAAGLDLLQCIEPPSWLAGSHLWAGVLSDLHRRNGDTAAAGRYRRVALAAAPPGAIRELLARRLQA